MGLFHISGWSWYAAQPCSGLTLITGLYMAKNFVNERRQEQEMKGVRSTEKLSFEERIARAEKAGAKASTDSTSSGKGD